MLEPFQPHRNQLHWKIKILETKSERTSYKEHLSKRSCAASPVKEPDREKLMDAINKNLSVRQGPPKNTMSLYSATDAKDKCK